MTIQAIAISHLGLRLLVAIVLLQSCIVALQDDFGIDVSNVCTACRTKDVRSNKAQEKIYLRTPKMTMTSESDTSDERGFNVGVPSIPTFNSLTTSATQKLNNIITNAKNMISSKNQRTTDMLFSKFKVDKVDSNLFESTQFQKWFNSVTNAYRNNRKEGEVTMVNTLTAHYGYLALVNLIIKAKSVSKIKTIAKKLEEAQFTKWSTDGKSIDNIFKLLKLDETGESFFMNPVVSSWVGYCNKFQRNPDEAMFLIVKKQFDDKTLARMLIAAKEDNHIATRLEQVELEKWQSSGKSSDNVFKLLNLNDETGNLLQNPGFNTWVSYATKTDKESPYDYVLVHLLDRYDDQGLTNLIHSASQNPTTSAHAEKLEVALQKKWQKKWIDDGKTADEIFMLLQLEKEDDSVFTSPMWNTWYSYAMTLEKLKEKPDEFAVISYLEKWFGDVELARILTMNKYLYGTVKQKKVINELQRTQFKKWVTEMHMNPTRLDKLLLSKFSDMHLYVRVTTAFARFYKTNGMA